MRVGVLVVCATVVLWAGIVREAAPEPPSRVVVRVESRLLFREIRFLAVWEPRTRFRLYARQSGEVKEQHARENQSCCEGDILLRLRNDALDAELLQCRLNLLEAEQELELRLAGLRQGRTTSRELELARQRRAVAAARRDMAAAACADLTLTAPFAGRVRRVAPALLDAEERNVQTVGKGDFVAELVRDEEPVLRGRVDVGDFPPDGAQCRAWVADNGRRRSSAVLSLRPAGGGDARPGLYEVTLEPPFPQLHPAAPGSAVSAGLLLPSRHAARAVPRAYVLDDGDARYCLVVRQGGEARVEVMTGAYDDQFVEVFGALEPGDTVRLPEPAP